MRLDVDELIQTVEADSRQSVPAEYRFSFHQNLSTSDRPKKAGRKAKQVAGVTALGLDGAIVLAGLGDVAVVGGFAALGVVVGFMGPDHHRIQGQVNKTEASTEMRSAPAATQRQSETQSRKPNGREVSVRTGLGWGAG